MCMLLLEEKKCNNVLEKFKQDFFSSFTLRQCKSFLTSCKKLRDRTRNEKTTFYAYNMHILMRRDYFFYEKMT